MPTPETDEPEIVDITLSRGEVTALAVIHEEGETCLEIFPDDLACPFVIARLTDDERRKLIAALTREPL